MNRDDIAVPYTAEEECDIGDLQAACYWATSSTPGAEAQASLKGERGWLVHHTSRSHHPCARFERITVLFPDDQWTRIKASVAQMKHQLSPKEPS